MGTRSLTVFFDRDDEEIVVMYRQFDGYVGGHGHDLASFLAKGKVVNGIPMDAGHVFNGMGDLAAQVVAYFKDGPGNFYLHSAGTRDIGEEYRYEVRFTGDPYQPDSGELEMVVLSGYKDMTEIFRGPPADLLHFTEAQED